MTTPPIEPWLWATARFEAQESTRHRRARGRRAEQRASQVLYVPPVDAPLQARLDQTDWTGRVGAAGRPRTPIPMRTVVTLWARGHGADGITAIAEAAGAPGPRSTMSRLTIQARSHFPGAERVDGSQLDAELDAHLATIELPVEPEPQPVPVATMPEPSLETLDELVVVEPAIAEPTPVVMPGVPIPELAAWLPALMAFEADEDTVMRLRRHRRAAQRADVVLYVPAADAPEHPTADGPDRYGRAVRSGRPHNPVPMRVMAAMWALGHGSPAVGIMARRAGLCGPKSTVNHLFRLCQAPFAGAEQVIAGQLTARVAARRTDGEPVAGTLEARMRAWRARYRVTQAAAARLAGIRPAIWRRLERGLEPRFAHVRDGVEELIATTRTIAP